MTCPARVRAVPWWLAELALGSDPRDRDWLPSTDPGARLDERPFFEDEIADAAPSRATLISCYTEPKNEPDDYHRR